MRRGLLKRLPQEDSTHAAPHPVLRGLSAEQLAHVAAEPAQRAKAEQLHALGQHTRARNVLLCGYRWPCGYRRDCPRCGARASADYAARIAACLGRMRAPSVVLFALPSRGLWDLRQGLQEVRASVTRLRRRKCMRGVTSGIGAVEMPVSRSGGCWAVHCHMALDGEYECDDVSAAYAAVTGGAGRLLHDPAGGVLSLEGFAAYITKPGSWSVEAGMDLRLLRLLRAAVRYRRPLVGWGPAWRERRS